MQLMRYWVSVNSSPLMNVRGDRNINAQNSMCRNNFSFLLMITLQTSETLLMTDGFYWIHVGCFLGRNVSEKHTYADADQE